VIGPFLHPRRYPPSRVPRPPIRQLRLNKPVGWLVERLTAPLGRWKRARLLTPEMPVRVSGLPVAFAGYRIALVTDMHCGRVVPTWWLENVAARCLTLAPDLVVLGGDFVSHARSDLNGLEGIVSRFRAPDGVVAVLGNHDHWIGAAAVTAALERGGAELLSNRHRLLRRGEATLAVAGVDDFAHGAVCPDDALRGVPAEVPRILVSHNPDLIEYLPAGLRVDVMLSGHTHNGQLHWPLIGPLTVPSQFGRRYLHGLSQYTETRLYVSAGVGSGAVPFRWSNAPELPMICLLPAD